MILDSRRACIFSANRRAFLSRSAGGIGWLAVAQLLRGETPSVRSDGLVPRRPHFVPRAKSVILLFQNGGPSQMDLFDPKPELSRRNGQAFPGSVEAHFEKEVRSLLGSPYRFRRYGQSGTEISELLPHLGGMIDDALLIRSMRTDSVDHEQALRLFHAGNAFDGRASWGSWVTYGLGSERRELPAYVVLTDPAGLPIDGTKNWSAGFLPPLYQGTQFRSQGTPVLNVRTPEGVPVATRQNQLELLRQINTAHLQHHPGNSELEARIANFELAAQMQTAVPAAVDVERETDSTQRLYGLDDPVTADYGRRCLMARRLVEQGVRFVSIYLQSQPWDTHSKNAQSLKTLCARTDRPSAALVADLKQRGLLDETIVIWAGEFGRLPVSQGVDGRDHNRRGFSLWIAGGGFRRGHVHGTTDDFGYESVTDVVSIHDLHATLLAALGLDHDRLSYPHEGRDHTLTDSPVTNARVIAELLA